MKTHSVYIRMMSLLLAVLCIVGLFPASALAASPNTIKLEDCTYNGVHYDSPALGICYMVNKLRFSEYDILGQTLLRLESAELKRKQKNTAAREISRNIADLNAKLVMVEQLHAKGYLKDEVHKAQVREINDQLRQLKRERQCEFSSGITHMIEELTRLKKLLEELEEPLDRFDEKLFTEIVQAISISRRDEMTVTLIGGLRFTEML